MKFSVVLTLDAGVARTVKLQLGYETGGATVFLQENNVELQQGRTPSTSLSARSRLNVWLRKSPR